MKLLYETWLSNSLYDWGMAAALLIGTWLLLIVMRSGATRILRSASARGSAAQYAGTAEKVLGATWISLLMPLGLYAGASAVELPAKLDRGVGVVVVIALLIQAALWINCAIDAWLSRLIEKRRGVDSEAVTILALLKFVAHVVIWTFALLLIL